MSKSVKSPFFIIEEFISPLMCEDLLDVCSFTVPDKNIKEDEIKTVRTSERAEAIIYERLLVILPLIQAYYNFQYKGTETIQFEWYPQGSSGDFSCENGTFLRGKWLRTKQRDFTAILFLSEYQDTPQFESEFEVYGGKLEFVQHKFSFQPNRGTLVIFPSDPHFINITSTAHVGDAFQARIQIAAKTPYLYNPQDFPGNYTTWFDSYLTTK